MKNSAIILFLILFSLTAFAQKPQSSKNPAKTKLTKTTVENTANEKEEFEKAVNQTDAAERISALLKFIRDFPKSGEKTHAQELIVSGRAEFADEKLRSDDTENGVEIFKLAVKGAPTPVSDKLFTEVILQIPTNLFYYGQRGAAVETAKMIEEKIQGNAKQLLGLATFYIGTENAAEAQRLAGKAIEIEPNLPAAYQTLGLANRLNFQLEDAANAYAKALELDPQSTVSRRSLAEMKRAVGKPTDAVELYREILAKDEADAAAKTGLILALLDAEKKTEAETELTTSLAQNPNNLPLLVGAAYWYAAHRNGAKAVELANKAVAVEPRYTWAHIALARGLTEQNRPLEAERALLVARQYGNFPTLDYELASVRLMAGFYREAANGLKKTFTVNNDAIETRLGGRVSKQAKSFIELLAAERRASIFEPLAADSPENAEKLKSLLEFSLQLDSSNPNEITISEAADKFAGGDDKMKLHRQIYAANLLLEKRIAIPKALELTKAAVGGVDAALDVAVPAAAVLADELYESRTIAISRNELVIIPDVPRQTLSNILRGRIEEITGWALYQQEKPEEAVTRFKRALSILPEKSAWWRDSMWRLGSAFQNQGKSKEALDAYIKSYTSSAPEISKRIIIESLYQNLNGNLDGLDEKIGPKPELNIAALPNQIKQSETVARVMETPVVEPSPKPAAEITPEISPTPKPEETPSPTPEIKPPVTNQTAETSQNAVTVKTTPTPDITATPEIQPIVEPIPSPTPEIKTESTPEVSPTPEINTKPQTEAKQTGTVKNQVSKPKPEQSQNSAFETIVITVPKTEPLTKTASEPSKVEDKPVETVQSENTVAELKLDKAAATTEYIIEKNASILTRPRIVGERKTEDISPCKILTSQETVSILNDGGSLGVLVGFEGGGDVKKIKAVSSSPTDIEITFEPEIGALSGRAFFVIKSVSTNKGAFTAIFESPCGKKEILVKVR